MPIPDFLTVIASPRFALTPHAADDLALVWADSCPLRWIYDPSWSSAGTDLDAIVLS